MTFRRPNTTWSESSLYEYAISALGRRMRTVAEMKRLLRQRLGQQPDAQLLVDAVVKRLKEQRYLNDAEYAATYTSLRKDNDHFGRFRVVSDLKSRGVHQDVIANAVTAAYANSSEEQLARSFLKRKRLQKPANKKEAARVFRSLKRAGFGARTIAGILKQWEVEDEVLDALEAQDKLEDKLDEERSPEIETERDF